MSNRKIVGYRIVIVGYRIVNDFIDDRKYDASCVNNIVEEYIREGWQPFGPPFVIELRATPMIFQSLVRYEEI